jgi:hypothetical protein
VGEPTSLACALLVANSRRRSSPRQVHASTCELLLVIRRLRDVSRLVFPSALLCAVGTLVAGCGDGVHSNALEPSASVRGSSAGVLTTATSHPTAHASAMAHRIRGTNGNDLLIGSSGRDIAVNGLRGSDIIRGGPETMC